MELTRQQKEAFDRILEFANDKSKSVFILKGYAGTGKTTMIKVVISELEERGKSVTLMAPTGRAAKVLRQRTGHEASTIHRGIYAFEKMRVVRHDKEGKLIETDHARDKDFRSKGSDDIQFWFDINKNDMTGDPSRNVYIIDESSMISSRRSNNEQLHFGTDILINDLLTYARVTLGGKVIFVGDPAQLPPVGDNQSVALDESFFRDKSIGVESYELTEVIRQSGDSAILKNAMMIRDVLNSSPRNKLAFERKQGEVEDIEPEEVIESFCENSPQPQIDDSIVICYTNALAKDYNDAIRRRYFPGAESVKEGDILQVVKNNVNTQLSIELFNGDFVRVMEVSELETQSAPVWTDVDGTSQRVTITINFRSVVLLTDDGKLIKCKIIDNLLHSAKPNLTPLEGLALYINFRMRHPGLKRDEEAFAKIIMSDPYYNAVQVKYGYAITGHKSQGGEWASAYVDYTGRVGLNNDSLRWAYTATTRASRRLCGVNMPNITPMSALKVQPVAKYSKLDSEALAFADVADVNLLPATATVAQKQKCLCVREQLDSKGFLLKSIQPLQYNDRYLIETPSGSVTVDCYYNGAGLYTRYAPKVILPENDEIMEAFENEDGVRYSVTYRPSCESFATLYNKMQSLCDDFDIKITNVVEHLSQYYVAYYLKTSGKFSRIMFYFNSNRIITYGHPFSDKGSADEKLITLIHALQ